MTRETRLVVILIAVGIAGIVALSFVADQYRKHVTTAAAALRGASPASAGVLRPDMAPAGSDSEDSITRAARDVDGFLAARQAAQGVCERYRDKVKGAAAAVTGGSAGVEGKGTEGALDVIAIYRIERMNAFAAHGMSYADYAATRAAWRAWMKAEAVGDAALAAAFTDRRAVAAKAGLGELESFDDAIK